VITQAEQPMIAFAANPCGDRPGRATNWFLLRILAAFCRESFAEITQDEQPMIAFAANPCGFCCESFAVITQDEQPTIAFAADSCGFCRESFAVIAQDEQPIGFCCGSLPASVVSLLRRSLRTNNQ